MHTVIETSSYLTAAKAAGLDVSEMTAIVSAIATNPEIGVIIPGTGGCRKMRFAHGGKGKSGGVRVVTFFTGPNTPVFLITVFAKNERANLSKAERNTLAGLTGKLVAAYQERPERSNR